MKREVLTCDVCDREIPLRGVKGQTSHQVKRVVRVRSWWHWPARDPDEWEPKDICDECWDAMVAAARDARKEVERLAAA